jgi:glucarate dehydratase
MDREDQEATEVPMSRKSAATIVSVRATPVSVPTTRPCAWSLGVGFGFTRTILELGTDDGLVGLGECEGSAAAQLINARLGQKLLGLPAHDLAAVGRLCRIGFRDYGSLADPVIVLAYAAIEMAMWDRLGKATGQPVYRLLGGAVRPQAQFGAYGYTMHLPSSGLQERDVPAAMAAYAKQSVARTGARIFEFKVGRYSAATDIETIRAVREALGPEITIGVDANQALDLDRVRCILRGVATARLGWFEEPVASLVDMTRLNQEFRVPISSHCTEPDTVKWYPDVEGIVGDLHIQGGLRGMIRGAAMFRALGHQFWQRSSLELGISWAAMVHAGVACPDLTRPSQCLIDYVEDDLTTGPMWLLRDGGVVPGDLPGLGVELDREALERYAELYRTQGEMTYFDRE